MCTFLKVHFITLCLLVPGKGGAVCASDVVWATQSWMFFGRDQAGSRLRSESKKAVMWPCSWWPNQWEFYTHVCWVVWLLSSICNVLHFCFNCIGMETGTSTGVMWRGSERTLTTLTWRSMLEFVTSETTMRLTRAAKLLMTNDYLCSWKCKKKILSVFQNI